MTAGIFSVIIDHQVLLFKCVVCVLHLCTMCAAEWKRATHRLHHIKLLPVLHLMDLVHIIHRRLAEVHSLFVKEIVSL